MAISNVQPVVVATTAQPAFTGGEEKSGTGLGLPILLGAATGGTIYALGSTPTAEGILKLEGQALTDTFTKLTEKAGKITDAAKKADAEGAIKTVQAELAKIKAATGDGVATATAEAKKAIEGIAEKLPKISNWKTASLWGLGAAAGVFVLAKLFGGHKKEEA